MSDDTMAMDGFEPRPDADKPPTRPRPKRK